MPADGHHPHDRAPAGARAPRRRGRHRRPRPLWTMLAVLLVVAALGATGGAVGGVRLARLAGMVEGAAGGDARCAGRARLHVVAATEIAPLVELAARALDGGGRDCPPVAVVAAQPARTAADLRELPPDAWVPSSAAWLALAADGGARFTTVNPQLARSPVVVAVPRPFAERLGWPDHQPGWAELAARTYGREIPRFSMPDPQRDTVGLLSVLGVRAAIGHTTPDEGIAQMRALTFRSRLADPAAAPDALLARMAAESDSARAVAEIGLFPASEQALWSYGRAGAGVPLVAVYPGDGLLEADYPLAVSPAVAGDPGRRELARRLGLWFHTPQAARVLAERGLRPARDVESDPAAGTTYAPTAPGLVVRYPAGLAPPADPAVIRAAAAQWSGYRQLAFQVLLLVDGSASMNDPVRDRSGRPTTKAELLRLAGVQAAQLFGAETSLAMWLFATPGPGSPPYREVVPFGPLGERLAGGTRRDALAAAAQGYQPYPRAGTPLYESVLRATAAMRQRYRSDAVTLVVVLTDGRDQDSPYAGPRDAFLANLAAQRDPARPVPVFCIGYGRDADMATLSEISALTGGRAVASSDPGDLASAMARVFLAAHRA